jgi:hypothetical protein
MIIDQDGYVGIGTTNPQALLHLYSGTSGGGPRLLITDNVEDDCGIKFADNLYESVQNFEIIFNSSTQDLRIRSDATDNIIYCDTLGNVGIGTDDPGEKLHVNGTVKATTFSENGTDLIEKYAAKSSVTTGAFDTWNNVLGSSVQSHTNTADYSAWYKVGSHLVCYGQSQSDSDGDVTITFPQSYDHIPIVTITRVAHTDGQYDSDLSPWKVTTTNFVINRPTSWVSHNVMNWMAMGPKT